MRKPFPDMAEKCRLTASSGARMATQRGDRYGQFILRPDRTSPYSILCIVCDGEGTEWVELMKWPLPAFDHVSDSVIKEARPYPRCPTWEEMCYVKDAFFEPEELVIQYHPPKSQYVNTHQYVLHLWKPIGIEIPLPPRDAV